MKHQKVLPSRSFCDTKSFSFHPFQDKPSVVYSNFAPARWAASALKFSTHRLIFFRTVITVPIKTLVPSNPEGLVRIHNCFGFILGVSNFAF